MSVYLYLIVFITQIILVTLLYIYHKLNDSKAVYDFFILNTFYSVAPILFITQEIIKSGFYKEILFKLALAVTFSSYFFLTSYLYEVLSNKIIQKKYHYISAISCFVIFISLIDLISFKFSREIYIDIENGFFLFSFVIFIIILIIQFNKINPEMQGKIIKGFMLLLVSVSLEELIDYIFKLPEYNETFLTYNLFFIGYTLKKILSDIEQLKNGDFTDKKVNLSLIEEKFIKFGVTAREKEIIFLLMNGKSNQNIADELFISINTVKIHIYNIYKKFNVNKRAELLNLLK